MPADAVGLAPPPAPPASETPPAPPPPPPPPAPDGGSSRVIDGGMVLIDDGAGHGRVILAGDAVGSAAGGGAGTALPDPHSGMMLLPDGPLGVGPISPEAPVLASSDGAGDSPDDEVASHTDGAGLPWRTPDERD